MDRAREEEKRYDWVQATKLYEKAANSASEHNDLTKAAALTGRVGFCFYRAAYQAQTATEFKERLELVIQTYEKETRILEEIKEENSHVRINQVRALITYARSCIETNVPKKKQLLDEWWTLENQVLEAYESLGDIHSGGVVCADMIEFSLYARLWLSNHSEEARMEEEALCLAEKAIKALSESSDDYELARAYCFASVWYSSQSHESPEFRDKLPQLIKKGHDYSKKALEYSLKTDDAWLIGSAYSSAMIAAYFYDFNFALAVEYGEETQKYGSAAKDNLLLSYGTVNIAYPINMLAEFQEDPDKQRASFERAKKFSQEGRRLSQIINHMPNICFGYQYELYALNWLATIEPDPKNKQDLVQNSIKIAREGIEVSREWQRFSGLLYSSLSDGLRLLSGMKSDVEEKKELLLDAQSYQKEFIAHHEELVPFFYSLHSFAHYHLGLMQIELSKIETEKSEKTELLEKAATTLEKSNELLAKELKRHPENIFNTQVLGKHSDRLGRVLQQIYYLTKEEKQLHMAIEAHRAAATAFNRGELPAHAAESYWYIAQIQGQIGKHQEASQNYEAASKSYDLSAKKIPQLKGFYEDYSLYMQAWSQIEQAKYAHSIENYDKAKNDYENAARLHESTEPWSYLSSNYLAWANLEEAESQSRKENAQEAKEAFQKALEYFNQSEDSIKQKIEEITSEEEKKLNHRLFEASDLRRRFCQARIRIEEARLLDRIGNHLEGSRSYGEAAREIEFILGKIDSEDERNELELLATLCQAWEKMAIAEETTSSESYLEAARLFEKAKEHCYTQKASLWTLGNSNFCKGLAAGVKYQIDLNLADHARAKSYMKNAATNYLQAGFNAASEYAKATQRLFDAYLVMNQAETEADQEARAKKYQMAENLLQIAAGSFVKAKQPEKTAQVQKVLESVKEEKSLAVSLNEVLRAPAVAASTMSFTAPTPTSEVSVGLEQFQHANVQANLIAGLMEVKVGESFCLTVEFVNAGKEPALLIRVEDFVPPDFTVVKKPEIYRLEESCLNMKGKQLAPLKLVEAKLVLQPTKKGVYSLMPIVHYLDELGQNRSLQLKSVEIKVEEVILSDRVSTGTKELDSLLLGGIPKEYAVVLTGSPDEERDFLIRNFLETGTGEDQASFYVSTEAFGLENLLERSSFHLFLCNPKPKTQVPDLPNVYKMLSKTDLTNISIAVEKTQRELNPSAKRRICLELISDVLLRHGAEATRRWLSEMITDLCSKGFTMLAVLDPSMHPPDQANALLGLFDGEISLSQAEDTLECRKSLRVKKLRNQDYIKNPICLTRPPT